MTIVTSLAFTLVMTTLIAGVATFAVSHFGRADVEGTYANAIAMAEAGVNYELAWISRDITDFSRAHQVGNAHVGGITGAPGQFEVYVRPWGSNCDGTGNWTPPDDLCIISTGTVHGISRTVRIRGRRKSIFDEYALYALQSGTFAGGGSASNATQVVGNLGTNGDVTFSGTSGTGTVAGELHLNGDDASSNNDGFNVVANPNPVEFPTVAEIAADAFPGGLQWLETNNDNAKIRMFMSTDTALVSEPSVVGFTELDVTTKLAPAGFTAASRNLLDPGNAVPSATSTLDEPGSGTRFVAPAISEYQAPAIGIRGKRTYFLPPGDYYFHRIDLRAGNAAIVLLTHLGRVRIWVDEGSNQQDYLQTTAVFTDRDPTKFRLYYNKCDQLNMAGGTVFYGGFYAVRDGCSDSLPNMRFTGGSRIFGSCITNGFSMAGGTQVIFPNNGGEDDDDFSLWYGFKDQWKEISPNGNPVFVDGTSR